MADRSIKVKFLQDRVVRDHDGKVVQKFKAGQVKELSEASARHWLSRNVAEVFMSDAEKAEAEESEAEAVAHKAAQRSAGREGTEHPTVAAVKAQKAAPKEPKKRRFGGEG